MDTNFHKGGHLYHAEHNHIRLTNALHQHLFREDLVLYKSTPISPTVSQNTYQEGLPPSRDKGNYSVGKLQTTRAKGIRSGFGFDCSTDSQPTQFLQEIIFPAKNKAALNACIPADCNPERMPHQLVSNVIPAERAHDKETTKTKTTIIKDATKNRSTYAFTEHNKTRHLIKEEKGKNKS